MTESTRTRQIELALKQRDEQKHGETQREPLRDKPLPVVEVPLDLPTLNYRSFRIAAQLEEHPDVRTVRDEPDSPAAQAIVAKLVLDVHRNVGDLRDSLQTEGQHEVGMITRKGVLINGNTRCILLRELRDAGKLQRTPMLRVAVLPIDYSNREELELELVLQQQKPLKDEYRFVNELLMIRKLRDEGFTEAEIARSRGLRKSAKGSGEEQVKRRLSVLLLMETMRNLAQPPLRLTAFDRRRDNLEAWLELLKETEELDAQDSRRAEAHLRRWMIAYFSGFDSVHKLRHAKETWVEDHVVMQLNRDPRVRAIVDQREGALPATRPVKDPSGLDLLGPENSEPGNADSPRVAALFQAVVDAHNSGPDGILRTTEGEEITVSEFQEVVASAVREALGNRKREAQSKSAVERPYEALIDARDALQECDDALVDALEDPSFAARRKSTAELATEVRALATRVAARLIDEA
ncbi:MAG: hypothetical protein KIT14_16135 [bacterium]|nr:hypothetical protein [bacterium]